MQPMNVEATQTEPHYPDRTSMWQYLRDLAVMVWELARKTGDTP